MGKTINDFRSPALASLPSEDVPSDRPVEQDQFAVDGQCGAYPGAADAGLKLLEKLRVAGRGL